MFVGEASTSLDLPPTTSPSHLVDADHPTEKWELSQRCDRKSPVVCAISMDELSRYQAAKQKES